LWDDGILVPWRTRDVLGRALSATMNAPIPEPGFSLYRM
jgi:3-methylcrotonyl-CoA carboxylase beta subunit